MTRGQFNETVATIGLCIGLIIGAIYFLRWLYRKLVRPETARVAGRAYEKVTRATTPFVDAFKQGRNDIDQ